MQRTNAMQLDKKLMKVTVLSTACKKQKKNNLIIHSSKNLHRRSMTSLPSLPLLDLLEESYLDGTD
jgi:hypothetical protein